MTHSTEGAFGVIRGGSMPGKQSLIAAALFTSRTTALTYYGAEIGMPATTPVRKEDVKDPVGIASWPKDKGRDGARTPMKWSGAPQAGLSSNAHTWLPVAPDYRTVNVEKEISDWIGSL